MKTYAIHMSAAALVVLALSIPSAHGYAKFAKLLPNGANFPDAPAIGHPDAEGIQGLNEFGTDWNKLGKAWTKAYCQADSDGDGFTNGQELGDPCCTWTPTNPGTLIKEGISHPSDKTKTPTNPKLQAKCSAGGGGTTKSPSAGATADETTDDSPGTVNAGPAVPEDDDDDDNEESATTKPKPKSSAQRSTGSAVLVPVVVSLVAACMW